MADPDVRPEAVDAAAAFMEANRGTYTPEALWRRLRSGGYTWREISLAEERAGLRPPGPTGGHDLRGRAAAILLLGTLGAWAAAMVALWIIGSQPGRSTYESASWLVGLGSIALGATLAVVLVPSLIAVGLSLSLRRGVQGAIVGILTLPFIATVVLAGMCVVTQLRA